MSIDFDTLATGSGHQIGTIMLNAPKAMNALSLDMIDAMHPQLEEWARDDRIVTILLHSAGEKAFCAGGDIRQLYDSMVECGDGDNPYASAFFEREYRLDYALHRYPKPIIAWGNGFIMGGGMGIYQGASHRVVTESSKLAMPEIGIGLFPDVGGSWFLSRAPGKTGLFAGLTGCRINASDALFMGMADRFVLDEFKPRLIASLQNAPWADHPDSTVASHVLRDLEQASTGNLPVGNIQPRLETINRLCDADTLAEVADQISANEDEWVSKSARGLQNGCPTTAHLLQAQLDQGQYLSLADIFRFEYHLALRCCANGEFQEGVRALIIDKDNQPKWHFDNIADVTQDWLNDYFGDIHAADHPLADLQ